MRIDKILLIIIFLMGHHLFFGQDFSSFKWKNRILLLEAKEAADHSLLEQIQYLKNQSEQLIERKLLIFRRLSDEYSQLNNDTLLPETGTLQEINLPMPDRFRLSLIGLDGTVKFSTETAVGLQNIFDLIDSMPMRKAELRNKN